MKFIILLLLFLKGLSGFSQTDKLRDSIVNPSLQTGYVRAPSSDSFDLCGLRFSTFRDCVEGTWKNCCTYTLVPFQVSCSDVGTMYWIYMPSVDIAEMNIKTHISNLEKEHKVLSKEAIYCDVLGTRVKAYHLKRTGKDRLPWSDIRMGVVVNGQAILLELSLFKYVRTNKQIPPVFKQILSLEK